MADSIRLLICEDSDDDALLTARHLERGGLRVEYERVDTARAVAEALAERPPDLVISDYHMPGFGAEDALALLRDSGLDVPFILMSGRIGEELAAELMRAGVHDVVLKGRMARLVPAVRRELQQARARREQREAQARLSTSEQRLRLFAEHVPDVMFRCRLRPFVEVEYLSNAAAAVFGRSPQELCGDPRNLFRLVVPEDRAALRESWRSPTREPLAVRWRRPDGTKAWTEQQAVAVYDDLGRVVAVEGILRDITDRVAADAQRDRLQQQLHQVERLESLGRLAGGIAHDFNNLLAVILGHAELALADTPVDAAGRDDLEAVRKLAEGGSALIRQLLVFSRQGRRRPETLDVNAVVAETERVLRGVVGEDVELVTHLAPDLRPVMVDRGELERLLLNLVANSRRAMPNGGRLALETYNVDPCTPGAPAMVRLLVTDTGVGMPEEVAQRAFEPFFTTDSGSGTGLGLSAAYGVVKAVGGEIGLTSRPGAGTTVQIDLPARSDMPARARIAAAGAEPRPEAPNGHTDGRGETVLVVEDDEDVRALVTRMLRRSGYRVVVAPSPAEALGIARAARPAVDLLVSDVVMPKMSGPELLRRIREFRPDLPTLLISGYSADTVPGSGPLPERARLLRKPFSTAALLGAISDALARPATRQGPR
jgi:two-component system, cell cycle sensor histidine kinase and response regulator CckA